MSSEIRLSANDHFPSSQGEIAIIRCLNQPDTPLHLHDFFEIALVVGGSAIHFDGQQTTPLARGDVIFLNRNQTHAFQETEDLDLINLILQENVLVEAQQLHRDLPGFPVLFALHRTPRNQTGSRQPLRLEESALVRILAQIDSLEAELERAKGHSLAMSRLWLYLILGELSRSYSPSADSVERIGSPLGKVLSWMDRQYPNFLKLEDIAEVAGMSERSLHRLFAETMGIAPMAYLNELRLRRASELLSNGALHLSIADIAQKSGFDDSNYFSRLFKRATGCSPKHYQQQHRERSNPSPPEQARKRTLPSPDHSPT